MVAPLLYARFYSSALAERVHRGCVAANPCLQSCPARAQRRADGTRSFVRVRCAPAEPLYLCAVCRITACKPCTCSTACSPGVTQLSLPSQYTLHPLPHNVVKQRLNPKAEPRCAAAPAACAARSTCRAGCATARRRTHARARARRRRARPRCPPRAPGPTRCCRAPPTGRRARPLELRVHRVLKAR